MIRRRQRDRSTRGSARIPGAGGRRVATGQSMVEFAVLAPIFFSLVFGLIDGGLLLYQVTAANQAVNVGANVLATKGSDADSDSTALARMNKAGLGVGTTVNEYDVYLLKPDGSNQRDTSSCSGSPCVQRYTPSGALLSGNWPPTARDVTNQRSSFVELDIRYSWRYFFATGTVVPLTATRNFRLEPQT